MQAAFQRKLQSGSQYDRFFPVAKLQRTDPVVMPNGEPTDTIELIAKLAHQYRADTSGVAPLLRGNSLKETCNKVWQFAYSHFQYTPDKSGVEQLRRPLRAWADRVAGIDCDCYSILVSTILLNLGIAHTLRITKYGGKAEYQHIYVVVPNGSGYYTIDAVTDKFDHEVAYSAKFDKQMSVQVLNGLPQQVLNGIPQQVLDGAPAAPALVEKGAYQAFGFGAEFVGLDSESEQARVDALAMIKTTSLSGLSGLLGADVVPTQEQVDELARVTGQTQEEAVADAVGVAYASASFIERLRQSLVNTAEQIAKLPADKRQPELVSLWGRIELLLKAWDNEPERTRLFAEFSALEDAEMRTSGLSGMGLGTWLSSIGDAIGNAASSVGHAVSSAAGAVAQAGNWTYGTVIKPVGQAIVQAGTWVINTVVSATKAAAEGIKNAAIWVAKEAVALGKLLLKYNPLSILIRAGLRIAFRVNLFYMSGRIGHGYFSEQQAQAFGMDLGEWKKAKSQLGKVISMWEGLQGDSDILRESIMIGYQSGNQPKIAAQPSLNGLAGTSGWVADTSGLGALGEPASGTATAASSGFIATIVLWLKNVDWDKLLKGVKAAAGVVAGVLGKYKSVPAVTDNTMLPTSEQDYLANQQKYETQKTDSGVSDLALPLVGLAAVLGIALFSSPKPTK